MLKHLGDIECIKREVRAKEMIFNHSEVSRGKKVLSYIKQDIESRDAGYFKALPHMWSCTEILLPAEGWHTAHTEKPLVGSVHAGLSEC